MFKKSPKLVLMIIAGLFLVLAGAGCQNKNDRAVGTRPTSNSTIQGEASDSVSNDEVRESISGIVSSNYPDESENGYDNEQISEWMNRASDFQYETDDLSADIRRLRNNSDSYDSEEYAYELKKLQNRAEDLSMEADDIGADDIYSSLDDAATKLNRERNEIEDEPRYFYRERENDLYYNLKKAESSADDAYSYTDDYISNLEDFN